MDIYTADAACHTKRGTHTSHPLYNGLDLHLSMEACGRETAEWVVNAVVLFNFVHRVPPDPSSLPVWAIKDYETKKNTCREAVGVRARQETRWFTPCTPDIPRMIMYKPLPACLVTSLPDGLPCSPPCQWVAACTTPQHRLGIHLDATHR